MTQSVYPIPTQSVDTELPDAAALADAMANPTTPLIGACMMAWNGSTWDRINGTQEGTLLASAARTANASSANQTNHGIKGVIAYLNVTVASGTGGLGLRFQTFDPVSGSGINLNAAPTNITATGVYAYEIRPGATTAGAAGTGNVQQRTSSAIPHTWRVTVTHADASSYTYSVGYALLT